MLDRVWCLFILGCSRKNPHLPDGWDSENSRGRGGQRLWKSRQEGGSFVLEIQTGGGGGGLVL